MNIMENNDIKIGLVIMASGLGKRYGGNKLMEKLGDKPIIKWVIDATEGLFYKRVVVTRNTDVKALCDSLNVNCIYHEFPDRNDTVRLGLSALIDDIDYCFFMQADQPLINKSSLVKLLESANSVNDKIIRAGYEDTVGSPMGFPKLFFDDLLHLPKQKGGNYVAMSIPAYVQTVLVQNEYELWDVDTKEDFERIRRILEK